MSSPSQKVVIPKGLVNPKETTIIEIPAQLHNVCTVVAKPKSSSIGAVSQPNSPRTPPGGRLIKKSSYLRRTFPKASVARGGMLHDAGITFAGRDYEDPADESSHGFHPYSPQLPSPPPNYNVFSPQGLHSTPKPHKDINASGAFNESDSIMYCSFRPPRGSSLPDNHPTPPGRRPQHTPPSLESYHSESSDPYRKWMQGPGDSIQSSPETSSSYRSPTQSSQYETPPSSYRKTSVTTELPDGKISQTEFEEESYETPGSSWETPSNLKTCNLTPWSSSEESPASPRGAPSPQNQLTQGDLMTSIGELESQELHRIMGDLSDFQNARRRLVFDASSLASAADVSSSLMSGTPPHGVSY